MRTLPMLVAALVLAGCSPSQEMGEAQGAIAMFHSDYNRGDHASILDRATQQMRGVENDRRLIRVLGAASAKLGPYRSGKLGTWRVKFKPSGNITSATYLSQFREGKATETFLFVEVDGTERLAGYHINSDAFLP